MHLHVVFMVLLVLALLGCSPATDHASTSTDYIYSIEAWQATRNTEMRDTSTSWLNLVDLHWLENGESTFGSDSSNTILLPEKAPPFAGSFILSDTILQVKVFEGVQITHKGNKVREMIMRHDMNKPTTFLQMGTFNLHAIQRPEGMAIRIKDSKNPALVAFEDIPNFEIDPDWKVEARLDWYETPKVIQIPTVLGSERSQQSPATLTFEVNGQSYRLHPYKSFYGDPVWTIIFGDMTNGLTSYGGGRFLTIEAPEKGTPMMTLDFNKAYNPPCAFSAFATCPLPPEMNRLAVAVEAGEKRYGEIH